jgi:hypothetical protein
MYLLSLTLGRKIREVLLGNTLKAGGFVLREVTKEVRMEACIELTSSEAVDKFQVLQIPTYPTLFLQT